MIDVYEIMEKIEAKAQRKKVSIHKLGKIAGLSTASWHCWKTRAYKPKLDTLQRLDDALDGIK